MPGSHYPTQANDPFRPKGIQTAKAWRDFAQSAGIATSIGAFATHKQRFPLDFQSKLVKVFSVLIGTYRLGKNRHGENNNNIIPFNSLSRTRVRHLDSAAGVHSQHHDQAASSPCSQLSLFPWSLPTNILPMSREVLRQRLSARTETKERDQLVGLRWEYESRQRCLEFESKPRVLILVPRHHPVLGMTLTSFLSVSDALYRSVKRTRTWKLRGIEYVGDLVKMSRVDVAELLSEELLNELEDILSAVELRLGMHDACWNREIA